RRRYAHGAGRRQAARARNAGRGAAGRCGARSLSRQLRRGGGRDMTALPVLAAEGLDAFYGRSHVLRGIAFRVMPGETVSLIGRNGMGKTTLLRTLMGLVPPARGRVMLGGKDVTGARPSAIARRGLAFVPEGRGIF